MHVAFLVAALPLTGAVPRGQSANRAETGDANWDVPSYNSKDHGPAYNLTDDWPVYDPKDDGPLHNPEDDGPRRKLSTKAAGGRTNNTKVRIPPPRTTAATHANIDDFRVTILADSNRDGKVDITGDTDLASKETWTAEFGALFLANIVDTNRRCSSQITGSCASELGDVFFLGTSLPEKPDLNRILEKLADATSAEKGSDGLSESDRALSEWWKKNQEYQMAIRDRAVNKRISECHDSSDDVLRNSTYLAPLRTTPNPGLSDLAIGSITVANDTAASKVRLFHKASGQWTFISSNYTFKAEDLKTGLELGIDARDVRRPGGWDGRVIVEFMVRDGEKEARDWVALRVAPVLTQHHGQPAEQLLTATDKRSTGQDRFIKDLREMSAKAGLKTPLHVFDTSGCDNDIWAQDFFEPGYMSIPGTDGPIGIHIMIRSAQDYRDTGRKIFQDLRSNTVGAVQHLDYGSQTDSTGNLETIPPYTHNGKSYAAGRAVMGSLDGRKPYMMAFLEAQETQAPIELDTSWLAAQHMDEFIQFLPVESERGWVMTVADPHAGLEILQKAQQDGHGNEMAVSRPRSPNDPPNWRIATSINDVLNTPMFASFQDACASNIEKNIDIIKRETGIDDAEIIRIPSLYQVHKSEIWQYSHDTHVTDAETNQPFSEIRPLDDEKQRHQIHNQVRDQDITEQQEQQPANDSEQDVSKGLNAIEAATPPEYLKQQPANVIVRELRARQEKGNGPATSLYPATINSVVLGNRQVLAPNPWGPVIQGQDVLAAAVTAAYAQANYTVRYIDDWFTHYKNYGDVHCGSNVIRGIATAKWW
ncbi:protein-arginine deiminase [Metarhizium robertsii]|uniref:Protein-arginine deiminase type-4 n=2 Tax=Metarhizium robertsii TaxID=568076 RepID=E9ENJ1_METRA|nr:protein-arginine deiminase type-4 [Metarhizium robertsii ARSEF 23]EFZ04203.1 protein-arginine deiminase type-4 [Metarhizium robertsii ARSEF 23]EXU95794.1 protein-arginine deiminase [Metarhizium robertsii]